jgi:CBS-domain-containing membrane protein
MRAMDVMTSHVICIGLDASVRSIAKLMTEHRISGVPVVDSNQQVVGMISEGDLLHRVETGTQHRRTWWLEMDESAQALAREYVKSHGRKAKDVMTRDVTTVSPSTELADIANLLETRGIKRVPVVKDGKLVGIVTRANLIRALASAPKSSVRPAKGGDHQISGMLQGELRHQKWAQNASVSVVVKRGIVHLWGTLPSDEQRSALRVAAETIPGVKTVVDHTTTDARPTH